ncbi:phage tail protein [Burkholderia cenocepacia]|uniref:phage tail fiber protein n=1 Tax=Burkholderia cenocepacia TaxID=95486 RepID=UPI002860FDA5|nr:phage tail protein [Burkholderia cenocepacia]MDR8025578.1 phage tail protein [Burkholderia cenocepacia]MDR8042818.1 phage tail protein [Burkholderia cenocepacia]
MAGNLIYITDAGRAALVAPGNTGTTAHQVTQIGLATAAFVFKPDMTALPSELKRITTFGGDTVAKDTIHIVIQDDSADQYKLYGFGLYLDNGVLFGVYVQNDPILEKAATSMLLLAADTVFASIDVTQLVFGPTSFLNPPATTERKGVVELATQAEVDAGADDTRAVTPKTAAARYAPLVRPQLTGPVSITSTSTDQDAQFAVAATSGALNRAAKIRFHGTFAAGTADTNARLIASIRAGYDGGTWGREYLDFWINRAPNDSNSDTNQVRAMRITYGGRVLIGNRDDDGKTAFQVGGDGAFTGGISSSGLDAGGANIRLRNGRDVLLRNDGSNFYLLLTNNSDPGASWNAYRPFTINVATGAVMLDDTGAGTYVGGQLAVKGMLNVSNGANEARMLLGPSGGYFFGTANAAGFYLPSTGAMFAFDFAKKNLTVVGNEVWNAGNLPKPAQTTGFTMSGQILAAEGTVDKPGISFVNDGAPDTGFFHIADGAFAVTNNGRETMRFLAGEPNRVLIGTPVDDGHMLQVGGNAITRGLHRFGTGSTTAWANCSSEWGYFRSNGNVSVGSEGATGVLQLIAGNSEIAKLVPGGRMTIGGTADDGVNVAQVAGSMRALNYFIAGQGVGDSGLIGMYKGANGPNIGFYGSSTIGAGALTMSTGGTERARVTANGKFVVGKTGDDGSGALIQANGGVKAVGGVGALVASNGSGTGQTSIILRREGGPVDQKQWEVLHGGDGAFTIRTVNDAYSLSRDVFYVTRGNGIAAGNMGLMPNGGRVLIGNPADDGSILNAQGLIRGTGLGLDGGAWSTIYFKNGTWTRFSIGKTDTENFAISAWADDGSTQSRVLDIDRGTQVVSLTKRPTWAGGAVPFDTGNFDPNSKVNKAGDTMTGDLRVKQPNNTDARGFVVARADGTAQAWFHGTMNGNYSAWATMNPDGSWKSNPIIVYNADNRVVFNSDIHVATNSRFYNRPTLNRDGWQADIGLRNNRPGFDSWAYLRARDGGGIEIINSAYNAATWSVDDWGTMYMRGQQILNTDGNLRLAFRGGVWLSDQLGNIDNALNSKAGAGARVQWDSGVNNFGTVDRLNGALPAPWVVCGLSGPGNGTANAIVVYGVVLRNQ